MGLSNELSCEAGSFSHCRLNPERCFSQRFGALFPCSGILSCTVCLTPSCSCWFICTRMWDCLIHNLPLCWVRLPPPCCKSSLPGCGSPPLLLVRMNISSLNLWLLDFRRVQFSVSSGCFLFLNLLSSFFWLCEEAQCVYLRLHLGWK